jgi:hypothetical protein
MSDDKLFFRESYEREEKIDRIRAEFITDDSDINRVISELGKDPSDYTSKQSILALFGSKLDESKYDELIDQVFEKHGEEGDRFNIKLLDTPSILEKRKLENRLETFDDRNLGEYLDYVNYSLDIEKWSQDSQTVDIRFIASGSYTDASDNLVVRTDEGDMQPIEEVTSGEVVEKEDTVVELRIFYKTRTVAMYNSGVNKSLKNQIILFLSGGEEE